MTKAVFRKGLSSAPRSGLKKSAAVHKSGKAETLIALRPDKTHGEGGRDPADRIMAAPRGKRSLTARQIEAALDTIFAARAKVNG